MAPGLAGTWSFGVRQLYRLFIFFGGMLVLALFAAMIGPYFIDWGNYRARLEQEASLVLGQPVQVDGEVTVRILPLPRLSFTRLTVGRNPDGTPMMTAQEFSVDAELMPFLSGEVRIVEMRLEKPDITVQVNESGAVSWTSRQGMLVDPQQIKLDNLEVRDATLRITGLAGGRELTGSAINAKLRAQSLVGPWRIEADGRFEGAASAIEISTGRLQDSGSIRVKAQARRAGLPYKMTGDGSIGLEEGLLTWRGSFEVAESGDAFGVLAAESAEPLPIRASGAFVATPNGVDVGEYRLEVGPREDPYTITGTAQATIREEVRFEVKADGRQIDLDRLGGEQQEAETADSLDRRIATLRDMVDRIPIPTARGRIDFVLPAIVAGDTVIRQVSGVAEPDEDRWRIRSWKALLPGNTTVEADGTLSTGKAFGFSGRMLLASRQPTGFAAWLTGNTNAALRGIGSAGFSADVTLTLAQAAFENLELTVGEATLRGRLLRLAARNGRPGIVAALAGDRINLDDLLAVYVLTQANQEAGLANHDLDIDLRASEFEGMGLVAQGIEAQFRMESGSLTVNRLKAADFYGVVIESAGKLTDFLDKPSGSFRLKASGEDASALAELAANRWRAHPVLTQLALDPALTSGFDAVLEMEARAQPGSSRGTIIMSGSAGGTRFNLRDRFDGSVAQWRATDHDASLRLDQASPLLLARQLALPVGPIEPDGPISLTADAAGRLSDELKVQIAANAPDADLSMIGSVSLSDDEAADPNYDLKVTFGARDADDWLLMAGMPLPDTGQGNPVALSFGATFSDEKLHFRDVAGNYDANGFSGEFELLVGQARPKASGKFTFDRVSAAFLSELVLGAGSVEAFGVDAVGPITAPMIGGVDLEGEITASRFEVLDAPELDGAEFFARARLSDNTLSLNDLAMKVAGGALTGNISLRNNAGVGVFGGQLSLTDADVATLTELSGFAGLISGRGDISANLDASAQTVDRLVPSLTGNGVLAIRDAVITGVTAGGLPTILAASEDEGFEIKPETVKPLALRAFVAGRSPIRQYSGAITVAGGKVALRSVQADTEGGTVSGDFGYDLVSGAGEATLTIQLDPGNAAVAGGEPAATLTWKGMPGGGNLEINTAALEGFLSLRAFEREQARVESLQEQVLEKQRLRHDLLVSKARIAARSATQSEEMQQLQQLQQELQRDQKQTGDSKTGAAATGPDPGVVRRNPAADESAGAAPPQVNGLGVGSVPRAKPALQGSARTGAEPEGDLQAEEQAVDLFREIEKKILGR